MQATRPSAAHDGPCSLVYLVLAHDQPDLLARLVNRLDHPEVRFVVHIDAHVDPQPFRQALNGPERVHWVQNPVKVRWAAFSQVESTLRAMRAALDLWGTEPTHHVVLSGVDYPLKSNAYIIDFMRQHAGQQFIRRFDIAESMNARQMRRIRGRHFRQLADRNTAVRKPLFVVEYLLRAVPRRLPVGVRFTSGSNWIALSTPCVAWCTEYAAAHPGFVRLFKGMFGPDEIFFHTLVENSPFVGSAGDVEPYHQVTELGGPWKYSNLHYLHPIVAITEPDTLAGPSSDPRALFARKFHEVASSQVLEMLDARAG